MVLVVSPHVTSFRPRDTTANVNDSLKAPGPLGSRGTRCAPHSVAVLAVPGFAEAGETSLRSTRWLPRFARGNDPAPFIPTLPVAEPAVPDGWTGWRFPAVGRVADPLQPGKATHLPSRFTRSRLWRSLANPSEDVPARRLRSCAGCDFRGPVRSSRDPRTSRRNTSLRSGCACARLLPRHPNPGSNQHRNSSRTDPHRFEECPG